MKTTISLLIHELNSGTDFRLRRRVRGEFVLSSHFFLYVQSGLKDFTLMCPNEVRPSPDVAVFVKALAVLSLGLLCVYCTVFKRRRT